MNIILMHHGQRWKTRHLYKGAMNIAQRQVCQGDISRQQNHHANVNNQSVIVLRPFLYESAGH